MADQEAPLLQNLQELADTLGPADVPHSASTANLIGAIVKVLEHQGVTVAEELFPAEAPVAETAVLAAQAAPDAVNALERLIRRAEDAVKQLEHHQQSSQATGETPAADVSSPPASAADTPADAPAPTPPAATTTPEGGDGPELDRA